MELFRFDGDPCKWPDFIQNFKNRAHDKRSFTDDIRMEKLLSVLDGEAKQTVISIGRNGIFYATAMKLEIWLENKVAELFNPISAIINHEEKQKRDYHKDSHHLENDNRNPYRTFLALGEGTSNYQANILRYWLCSKDHKIAECNQFDTFIK